MLYHGLQRAKAGAGGAIDLPRPDDLLAYYPVDEGAGNTLYDISGNNRHAVTIAPWSTINGLPAVDIGRDLANFIDPQGQVFSTNRNWTFCAHVLHSNLGYSPNQNYFASGGNNFEGEGGNNYSIYAITLGNYYTAFMPRPYTTNWSNPYVLYDPTTYERLVFLSSNGTGLTTRHGHKKLDGDNSYYWSVDPNRGCERIFSNLQIGKAVTSFNPLAGKIRKIAFWDVTLTQEEMESITI